jgi:hypothetical protein
MGLFGEINIMEKNTKHIPVGSKMRFAKVPDKDKAKPTGSLLLKCQLT